MINGERLDSVRKKYGHYASWAVWGIQGLTPKSGMGDISFFEDPSEELLATLNPERRSRSIGGMKAARIICQTDQRWPSFASLAR